MKNEYAQKLEKLFQGADEASVNRALSLVGEYGAAGGKAGAR